MKYILCECGKRYREDNKKHFESEEHKKYIRKQQLQESNSPSSNNRYELTSL